MFAQFPPPAGVGDRHLDHHSVPGGVVDQNPARSPSFPSVAPPSVVVTVAFPGASANVLVDSVLVILEQAINGVPDMRYMASAATSAGEATIMIIFEPGTDPNVAVLNVQNRIQTVKQQAPAARGAGGHHRHAGHDEHVDVREYLQHGSRPRPEFPLQLRLRQPRCPRSSGSGASAAPRSSAAASMPCGSGWISTACEPTTSSAEDVMEAIGEQSMIGSPGRLGQATGKTSQTIEYVLTWVGRYNKPEQYENIVLKANPNGEILRLQGCRQDRAGPFVLQHLLGHRRPSLGRHRSQADFPAPTPPSSLRRSRRSSRRSRRRRSPRA